MKNFIKNMKYFTKNMKNKMTEKAVQVSTLLSKKSEGVDGLIVTVGLILVVVVLLFLFKDKIVAVFNSSLDDMGNQINSLGSITPAP